MTRPKIKTLFCVTFQFSHFGCVECELAVRKEPLVIHTRDFLLVSFGQRLSLLFFLYSLWHASMHSTSKGLLICRSSFALCLRLKTTLATDKRTKLDSLMLTFPQIVCVDISLAHFSFYSCLFRSSMSIFHALSIAFIVLIFILVV